MKNCIITLLLLTATSAFAQDFTPNVMDFDAPETITYDFDGSELTFDVIVSGAPANSVFAVFTKGKAEEIGTIQNGHLGWHYVNNIDTCIYYTTNIELQVGDNTITWNGTDNDGALVPAGEYTYYLWGYDNINPKTVASPLDFGFQEADVIQVYDKDGNYLERPIIWDGGSMRRTPDRDHIPVEVIHNKWIIGNPPEDESLIETTMVYAAEDCGSLAWDENAPEYFFKADGTAGGTVRVIKYLWVPNGESEIQEDWAEAGIFEYPLPGNIPTTDFQIPLVTVKGGDHIFAPCQDFINNATMSELIYIDMTEGYEDTRVDLSAWWVSIEDGNNGGQSSGGPNDVINAGSAGTGAGTGLIHLAAHGSCLNQLIDPYRYGEVGGDINDLTLWVNGNGDYVGDHNFDVDDDNPWVCHDYNVGPYKYWTTTDANGFAQFPTYDMGAVSFGLYLPDGTGVARFAFAGETAGKKSGLRVIQYGSAYDGVYSCGRSIAGNSDFWWYSPQTSTNGTISYNSVAVEEEAPAAFAVAQNTPNPFNPTTTISFSIADAGQVDIDVFNVAGQKIDSIASEHLSAGSHTVTWDASGFSAGVYFYTVKAEGFSKTMKMTLLK